MSEKRVYINENISIAIKNIIIQNTHMNSNNYSITLNGYIDNIKYYDEHKYIELYYYWTIDQNLNILDTSYIRYHIKGANIDWNNVDRILSNLALEELHEKVIYDKFNKMNI